MSAARRARELETVQRSFGPDFLTFAGAKVTTALSDGGLITLMRVAGDYVVTIRRTNGQSCTRFRTLEEAAAAWVLGSDHADAWRQPTIDGSCN